MKPSAEKNYSLIDNPDGTCNCRPLLGGCFFTDGFDGRCDCKCHQAKPAENWEKSWEQVRKDRCLCDSAYKDRQLTDPNCAFCFVYESGHVHSLVTQALEEQRREIEGKVKELHRDVEREEMSIGSEFSTPRHYRNWAWNDALDKVLQIIQNMK